jgi:hypothetical protein
VITAINTWFPFLTWNCVELYLFSLDFLQRPVNVHAFLAITSSFSYLLLHFFLGFPAEVSPEEEMNTEFPIMCEKVARSRLPEDAK